MVQNVQKMTVPRIRYLVLHYHTNYRRGVCTTMPVAVHHSTLCHHIQNCNSGPSARGDIIEIKWHAALQKNGAVEMGLCEMEV
jgi:hypothetical protein